MIPSFSKIKNFTTRKRENLAELLCSLFLLVIGGGLSLFAFDCSNAMLALSVL